MADNKKIPNVPNLRFPEFNKPWSLCLLKDAVERIKRKNTNLESKLPLTISAQYGLIDQREFFGKNVASNNLTNYYLLYNGDFAYNKSYSKDYPWGATKRLNLYDKGVVSNLYICFRPTKIDSSFLEKYFETNKWYRQISDIAGEGARNHGLLNMSTDDFFLTKHFFPERLEQEKIALLVEKIQNRIATQNKIIEDLKEITHHLINTDSNLNNEFYINTNLSVLLNEIKILNKNNRTIYSVAVEDGVVNQIAHLGRSFSAKDTSKYHVVNYGDCIYTKSPTGSFPYGIVKQSFVKEQVAVSPLYGIYKPLSFNIGFYLHNYFLNALNCNNYLRPLVNKGAKNTMNITNQRFLEGNVLIPAKWRLEIIVNLLTVLNKKINYETKKINLYKEQKNYLLTNMFI